MTSHNNTSSSSPVLSFGYVNSIRGLIRDFAKVIRGFEDKDVIQLTFARITSLLSKIDRNNDQKAFEFLGQLMPSWNNDDKLLLMSFCIEKARPLLLGRRSLIQQEQALLLENKLVDIKEKKFGIIIEKLSALYVEQRTFEIILAGNDVSDLDFGNNNYQEQAIAVDTKIRELKEQILAL